MSFAFDSLSGFSPQDAARIRTKILSDTSPHLIPNGGKYIILLPICSLALVVSF